MSTRSIDQMIEDLDELLTCDESLFFASLMTSDVGEDFIQALECAN